MKTDTIGDRLTAERKRLSLTQVDLANLLGVTPLTARNYEKNETHVPSDKLEKLSEKGLDINYIITGKTASAGGFEKSNLLDNNRIEEKTASAGGFSPREGVTIDLNDYAWIPLYDVEVSAGDGRFLDKENILTYMSFTKHSLRKRGLTSFKDLGYVIVHGDSMADTLLPNDCLLINFAKRNPDGGIFVVRVGDALHVKRLIKEKDCIRVISDNTRYPEWTLDGSDDFEIIGKYEWHGRYAV